jgi:hypothetical protein
MRHPHARFAALLLAAMVAGGLGACSQSGLPSLPSAPSGAQSTISPTQLETGAVSAAPATPAAEVVTIAAGTPTDIYARVASGALRCWFGANGPLKATHIFNAEAAPPSDGGVAEIVLHERDLVSRDQRGTRAFRIAFIGRSGNVEVGVTPLKIGPPMSELMVRDVETWAQGGSGCNARALTPPAEAAAPPASPAKPKATQSTRR